MTVVNSRKRGCEYFRGTRKNYTENRGSCTSDGPHKNALH